MAQTLPSDLENKIAQFRQAVYEMRLNGDFEYDLIANMDETPVFFFTWFLQRQLTPKVKGVFELGQLSPKNSASLLFYLVRNQAKCSLLWLYLKEKRSE